MTYFFQLPQYFSRQIIAFVLTLLTFLATPAAGQFLSNGVTPVKPIPNSNATLLNLIASCLAEQPVTGLCTTWGDSSGYGAIPSWDVSNVTDFGQAFKNRTTFNGDISKWDTSISWSFWHMFVNAHAFNQDISQWDTSKGSNFNAMFHHAYAFNQDISGWDVSSGTDLRYMINQAHAFNQDIRRWTLNPAADTFDMFVGARAMAATYGSHPLYTGSPWRAFFHAPEFAQLHSVGFPTEPTVSINFSLWTYTYNVTVPDRASIDIKVRPFEFDNVGHPNAKVTIDGSAVLTPDAAGFVTHTVPITATVGAVQAVLIVVTAPDGVSTKTYTLNMTVNFITDSNIRSVINSCLAEAPVTGLCVNYSASSGHPVMPNWNVSNVTNFGNAFKYKATFDGDISKWDTSNAVSFYHMFLGAAAFNQDISQWDTSKVLNFNSTFHQAYTFNQDISGWDVSSGTTFDNMMNYANAFNQDIRKWTLKSGATTANMFQNAPAMTATFAGHLLFGPSPWREFFHAPDSAALQDIAFPKNSKASINFSRNTKTYSLTIFDEKGFEIRVRPFEFDNVWHPNASVSIGASGPLTLDAQGYATYTVPVTMTVGNPNQTVVIKVTSPDGGTVETYTLNLSAQVIDDSNFKTFVQACLAEDNVGGICPIWASSMGLRTMPDWDVSDVTNMNSTFAGRGTFNADISKWDTSNVTDMTYMFHRAIGFNQDISAWNVSSGLYFASMFNDASGFDQDISNWDVSSVVTFQNMFWGATAFNQDIRKWPVKFGANLNSMFINATALHARFAGTTYFANTPREAFFYAFDTTTLEDISFPNDPTITMTFNRANRAYAMTVPHKNTIDLALAVTDFSNVNNQTATITVDSVPVALDPQGKGLYALPINTTLGTPQVVTIAVTASDGVTIGTYTLTLTVDFLTNSNIAAAVAACLAEAPVTGNCTTYSATSGRPTMPNWNVVYVTDMSRLFQSATTFNSNISAWDVSNVTTMESMFNDALAFNQDISSWDVGKVTNMALMFDNATSFDKALSVWNVSNVTNMSRMFAGAISFNSSLKNWNVSNVTDMSEMFFGAGLFDQDIGGWTVTNVTTMKAMFKRASSFNQNISAWRPQQLTDISYMFDSASNFNQDIGQWDVSKVTTMASVFSDAQSFNQNVGPWDVSNVTDMSNMFSRAPFNQNLGNWNVGKVTDMSGMFFNSHFNYDISRWDTSNVTTMESMFGWHAGFAQDLSAWDTSKVFNFNGMFYHATWMTADLRRWEVGPTATFKDMFTHAGSQHTKFGSHPFFGNTPRREFFYARDVATLEDLNFPNDPNIVISFNPNTTTYNVTVPHQATLDIGAWVTEYDNSQVQRPNASVKIDGTPVTFNAQGILSHTVSLNMAALNPNQTVLVEVTSPDTNTTQTYTLNLTAAIIVDSNLATHVAGCLNEAPVTGLCVNYAASQQLPTMPSWQMKNVTDLSNVFQGRTTFDADISAWDTSGVTTLAFAFDSASAFNQDISRWDTSGVTTLASAFASASAFNQDISGWDTSKVTDMSSTFQQSTAFDQDIGGWDVNAVTSFTNMLDSAARFDQEIRGWQLNAAVTAADLTSMFAGASAMHTTYTGVSGFANSPTLSFFSQSSDATLANLSVSGALLPITFSPAVQTYSVTVPYQTNATVNLTVNEFDHKELSYASAAVGGTSVTLNSTGSGIASVPLTATPNTAQQVNILVTAPDGSTLTYTVNITRQSNDASLSNLISSVGSLSPVFAPGTLAYGVTVPHATTSLTLTPTVNEPNATVVVNNGSPITLSVGANPVPVIVTSQDGSTTRQYTVTVNRLPSSDATLSNLTSSSGTLSPSFAPGTTAYSVTVANSVTTLSLTPTVNEPNATAVVNSGTAIALTAGVNAIPVEVTAQDGTTKITYTVTVNRAAAALSSDATLSNLTSSSGTLSPSFAPGTTAYSVTVANSVTTLTLTPTVNDPNATAVVNSGTAIALAVGANAIPVEVTAQDGTTKITYTVTVNRAAALQAVITGPTTPASGPFSVVITFSQPVTQFTISDVTVVNGTATTMTGSGTTYTLTVSPTSGPNVSISVAAGMVSGSGGTLNTASNVLNVQVATPATALAAAQSNLEQIVLKQAQKALSSQASIDQRMIRTGTQRLVMRQRLNRQQSNRFLPLDVDGTARFNNGEFRLNGDFFALSSNMEQSAEVVTTGAFNFVSDRDSNFSGNFNGRTAMEVQLSLDMVLGYFLGVEVGRARLSGTFAGRQDSYGLNAGGYLLRAFNDTSYITGFAAVGRSNNQMDVSNGTLQVDSRFDSTTLRLGASATGVFRMPSLEIWPELTFSYARLRVGTQAVAAQAYGLTANNLSLAGGDAEMAQLMFMPQFKWPLGDGRDGAAVANFSLSPRLTCRATQGVGKSRNCGTGAALGYSAASGNGLTLFNATVEFDNVAGTKNGSLTLNVEHNF